MEAARILSAFDAIKGRGWCSPSQPSRLGDRGLKSVTSRPNRVARQLRRRRVSPMWRTSIALGLGRRVGEVLAAVPPYLGMKSRAGAPKFCPWRPKINACVEAGTPPFASKLGVGAKGGPLPRPGAVDRSEVLVWPSRPGRWLGGKWEGQLVSFLKAASWHGTRGLLGGPRKV